MTPILGYWNIRGLAVPIRYLLEYVGEEYEWKAYDLDKPQEWQEDKERLGLEFPSLPYYIDGNVKITQTMAILSYLARKHNLIARNEKDELEQDTVDGVIRDLTTRWRAFTYFSDDMEKRKQSFRSDKLNPILQLLEHHLVDRDYVIGNYLTYSDFSLFERLECSLCLFRDALDKFPNLQKHHGRILKLPGIKEFKNSERFVNVISGGSAEWHQV